MDWDEYFLKIADLVAQKSKDPSTKVGAVIVGPGNEIRSTGFNGFPRGVEDRTESRYERPIKYKYTEHAETNAILNAARNGVSTEGCTLYLNFKPIPCSSCTRAVIQAGISCVVGNSTPFPGKGDHWEEDLQFSETMLKEAGVKSNESDC